MSRPNKEGYQDGENPFEYLQRMRSKMAPGFSYDQRSLYRAMIDAILSMEGSNEGRDNDPSHGESRVAEPATP